MPNKSKKFLVKIFVVLIILIGPITQGSVHGFSDLIAWIVLVSMVLIVSLILKKWYLEYKKRKIDKEQLSNISEKVAAADDALFISRKETMSLIFINIIFVIFSFINAWIATDLASLRGSARAQGEFIYFIFFPIYIILAIAATVISYRNLNKQYIFRGLLAVILLPGLAFSLEEWGKYLFDSGLNYFFIIFIMTIITAFIFFSPVFTKLFKVLKSKKGT